MTPGELLAALREREIHFSYDPEREKLDVGPAALLTDEIAAAIREHRGLLVWLCQARRPRSEERPTYEAWVEPWWYEAWQIGVQRIEQGKPHCLPKVERNGRLRYAY